MFVSWAAHLMPNCFRTQLVLRVDTRRPQALQTCAHAASVCCRTEKGSVRGGFPMGLLDCTRLRRLCLSNAGDAAFPALPPALSQLQDLDHLILYDCGVAQVHESLNADRHRL